MHCWHSGLVVILALGSFHAARADGPPAGATAASGPAASAECVQMTPYGGQPMESLPVAVALPEKTLIDIGAVHIVQLPVFDLTDPEQNNWLYRLAMSIRNSLGLNTREWVINDELLFHTGDRIEPRVLEETERLLRSKRFVYDARVLPARKCGNTVDIDVVTRDVWTLSPRTDLSRAGGTSNVGIGVSDNNIFGTGKDLSFGYLKTIDGKGLDISYFDPNVYGTRHEFGAALARSDRGFLRSVSLGRPFYSLDTHYAWGMSIDRGKNDDRLFFRGKDFARFEHAIEQDTVFVGWSPGFSGDEQLRLRVGYVRRKDQFQRRPKFVAPAPFPDDRELAYPFIALDDVQDDFRITRNLNQLQRNEDLNTGRHYTVQVGYSTQGSNRYVTSFAYGQGHRIGERTLLLFDVSGDGTWRTDTNKTENVEVESNLHARIKQSAHFSTFGTLTLNYVNHLTPDRQLLLGGDNGLRGYPLRYQLGDRSFLASLEERYFSDLYLMKLLRVGGAVYVDAGRAWFPGGSGQQEAGLLGDVGFGLRLESTRTPSGHIVHIDLAFPLVKGVRVNGPQFLISLKQTL